MLWVFPYLSLDFFVGPFYLKIVILPSLPLSLIQENESSLFLQIFSPLLFSAFLRFFSSECWYLYLYLQYLSIFLFYILFCYLFLLFTVRSPDSNLPSNCFVLPINSLLFILFLYSFQLLCFFILFFSFIFSCSVLLISFFLEIFKHIYYSNFTFFICLFLYFYYKQNLWSVHYFSFLCKVIILACVLIFVYENSLKKCIWKNARQQSLSILVGSDYWGRKDLRWRVPGSSRKLHSMYVLFSKNNSLEREFSLFIHRKKNTMKGRS